MSILFLRTYGILIGTGATFLFYSRFPDFLPNNTCKEIISLILSVAGNLLGAIIALIALVIAFQGTRMHSAILKITKELVLPVVSILITLLVSSSISIAITTLPPTKEFSKTIILFPIFTFFLSLGCLVRLLVNLVINTAHLMEETDKKLN